MNEMHDDELRSRFAELRAADEAGAPDFRGVLDRAAQRTPGISRTGWRSPSRITISLAVAAAVVFAIGLTIQSRQRRAFVPVNLSIWTSPTASLLRTPGSELITSPILVPSMVDPPSLREKEK